MERIVKYDVLRVVASFSIVLLHVSASYWSVVDIYDGEFLVMTIYNSLTRFAVQVFFMLSCAGQKKRGSRKAGLEIGSVVLCVVGFLRFSGSGS